MTYRVLMASIAQDEIDRFAIYAAEYSDDFAREQFARLNRVLSSISWKPLTCGAICTSPARPICAFPYFAQIGIVFHKNKQRDTALPIFTHHVLCFTFFHYVDTYVI